VICENDAGNLSSRRQWHLERIALHVTSDRACDRKSCFRIVDARRQDQCPTATALLVAGSGIKR
jgi:hypothetical protein